MLARFLDWKAQAEFLTIYGKTVLLLSRMFMSVFTDNYPDGNLDNGGDWERTVKIV